MNKVQQTGVRDVLVQGDVSQEDVQRMVARAVSELGGSTCSSTTPASRSPGHSDELASDDFDKVLAVNLRGAFLCAREAIRHFLEEGKPGVIINVSSVHQLIPKPDYLGYSVSKGGMQNLTRTLALEYAGRGIRVNGIGPGATVTPINRAWIDDPVKREMVESHIPMGRAGTAEEMGAVRLLPGHRRRRLHHRSDDLRRRRPDAVPELPRALVLGMTVDAGTRAGHARPDRRRQAGLRTRGGPPGRMYDLGHVLDEHVPVFPGRYFKQTLVTTAHHANADGGVGENRVNWITELVSGTMQLGTHLDALSHLQMEDRGYGGFSVSRARGHCRRHAARRRDGAADRHPRLARRRRRPWPGDVITPEHCADIDPQPGDAVLFHTGWGRHWDDPETYLRASRGRAASWRSGWPSIGSR